MMNLLYIGTLSNRKLEITIEGFHLFLKQNLNAKIHYTIVGDGNNGERAFLHYYVDKLDLNNYI